MNLPSDRLPLIIFPFIADACLDFDMPEMKSVLQSELFGVHGFPGIVFGYLENMWVSLRHFDMIYSLIEIQEFRLLFPRRCAGNSTLISKNSFIPYEEFADESIKMVLYSKC